MTKMLILAEDENLLNQWQSIFSLASPTINFQLNNISDFCAKSILNSNIDIVFISTNGEMKEELDILFNTIQPLSIPIICTNLEGMSDLPNEELMKKGIHGIIDINLSVFAISDVLRIVRNGGLYIKKR